MNWVNLQRDIKITKVDGRKVIIKKDKVTKVINEYFLIFLYSLISVILLHPSSPPKLGRSILINESEENRQKLNKIGIPTPHLYHINKNTIIEEYIEDGNLYKFLKNGGDMDIVFKAGAITGNYIMLVSVL